MIGGGIPAVRCWSNQRGAMKSKWANQRLPFSFLSICPGVNQNGPVSCPWFLWPCLRDAAPTSIPRILQICKSAARPRATNPFFFFIFVHSNFNIYFRISIIEKSISGKGWFINMNHYSWEIFHSIFPRIMVKYSITIDIHLSPMKTDATHGNIFLASDLHQK